MTGASKAASRDGGEREAPVFVSDIQTTYLYVNKWKRKRERERDRVGDLAPTFRFQTCLVSEVEERCCVGTTYLV